MTPSRRRRARGDEIPAASGIGPGKMRTQHPPAGRPVVEVRCPCSRRGKSGPEIPDELHRVDVLPDHVGRVPVDPERFPAADHLQRTVRRVLVVGDLGRVNLVGGADSDLVEHIEDGIPPPREVGVTRVDHIPGGGRAHSHVLPDGRAGEPHHRGNAEPGCRSRRVLDRLGGALPHPSGSPSPQTELDRIPRWRTSIGSSQTAWPCRWADMAKTPRPCRSRISRRDAM